MVDDRRRDKREPAHNADLDVTNAYQKEGDPSWYLTAEVYVSRERRPAANVAVAFFKNGELADSETTGGDGRVSQKDIVVLPGSSNLIAVNVVFPDGVTVSRRVRRDVPYPKLKVPTNLKVYAHPEGPAKEYFCSIELYGEDKAPIKGWPLEIKDPAHPTPTEQSRVVHTGDDGAYRFKVGTDKRREIFISVVGTELDYTLKLAGPRRKDLLPPPDVPEPGDDELEGSWLDITLRAFCRGREDLRRQRQGGRT